MQSRSESLGSRWSTSNHEERGLQVADYRMKVKSEILTSESRINSPEFVETLLKLYDFIYLLF